MIKHKIGIQRTGSRTMLVTLWLFFFWIPIIPIFYWLFKMKKTKVYSYDK